MDKKVFAYQEEMDKLSLPCPPKNYITYETVAYRWGYRIKKLYRTFFY